MTAGKSVLKDLVGGTNTKEAFQSLDQMLVTRLRETI